MTQEMVLCVPTNKVWLVEGFTTLLGGVSHIQRIFNLLDSYATLELRDNIENNPEFKQIVVYTIVKKNGKLYKYRRASGDDRLVERYSIGIGGHVNLYDMRVSEFDTVLAVENGMYRELMEELVIKGIEHIYDHIWLGIINDNSDPVGRTHLGIVFEIDVGSSPVFVAETGLANAQFEDMSAIKENIDKYESWSQILIAALGG